MSPLPRRLDLTRQRAGARVFRSITLVPIADGGERITVHVGLAELGVELSAEDSRQLLGMLTQRALERQQAEEVAS